MKEDINPDHENKHLAKVFSFISLLFHLYYSKMYSSHDNLSDTSFVLLQLKSASLRPLSKLP